MSNFSIIVDRQGVSSGTLRYSGSFQFSCQCWWDPADEIPAATYVGCSATHLASKLNPRNQPREGIFLPNVPGRTGIFIHYWPGPGANIKAWSDGCALVLDADMLKIWNDIVPVNGRNVTVTVKSSAPTKVPTVPVKPGGIPLPFPNTGIRQP